MRERLDGEVIVTLFQQWAAGDSRAMDEMVRMATPLLWHTVRAYGLSRPVAEDVIQTTWLTLVRKHDSIEQPAAVVGWLVTTARREAWRASRVNRRAIAAEDMEPYMPTQDSAEATATERIEHGRLWAAVAALDPRCRRLLRIVAFAARPDYASIARDLSMPVGSIGPTRLRCLSKLRDRLAPHQDE